MLRTTTSTLGLDIERIHARRTDAITPNEELIHLLLMFVGCLPLPRGYAESNIQLAMTVRTSISRIRRERLSTFLATYLHNLVQVRTENTPSHALC